MLPFRINLVILHTIARYFSEKRKNKDYVPHDKTILNHVDAVLKLLGVMSGDRRYETILANPEQKSEVKTMDDALTRVINEGHTKGLAEGLAKGRSEAIRKMLQGGFSRELILSMDYSEAELKAAEKESLIQM